MTALTLTPDPDTAAVLLKVTGAPAGAASITRTDANGTAAVRLREGQAPIGGGLTVSDYEAALTGPLRYDVTDAAGAVVSASTALGVAVPWLGVPTLPQLNLAVELVTGYDESSETTGAVHDIVRAVHPVPALGPLGARRGRMELWAPDYAAARRVRGLYAPGEVAQLRQPDHAGMDLYHVATRVGIAPDRGKWRATVEYREVAVPSAPLQGALGWTWADLSTRYSSWAAVRSAFTSWADLAAGPVQ